MKVIFCDFDGMIRVGDKFSKSAVSNLNKLLKEVPEAKIVISSSWRHKGMKVCKDTLSANGVDVGRVIGMTDILKNDPERGHHIQRWLDSHKEVDKFVILDDKSDMRPEMRELVQTNPHVGLTSADVKKAVKLLS